MSNNIIKKSVKLLREFDKGILNNMYRIDFISMSDNEHIQQLQKSVGITNKQYYGYEEGKTYLNELFAEHITDDILGYFLNGSNAKLKDSGLGFLFEKYPSDTLFILPFVILDEDYLSILCNDKDRLNEVRKDLERKFGMLFGKAEKCKSDYQNTIYHAIYEGAQFSNRTSCLELEVDLDMGEYSSIQEVKSDIEVEIGDLFFKDDRSDCYAFIDEENMSIYVKDNYHFSIRFDISAQDKMIITISYPPITSKSMVTKDMRKVEAAVIKFFQNNNFSFYSYEIQ